MKMAICTTTERASKRGQENNKQYNRKNYEGDMYMPFL
jgi:hypothetical protein